MPRETCRAPATLPLFSTSGASRTSTTRVLPLAIMSRACASVMRGTAALAASIICLTLVAVASSSFQAFKIRHAASTVRNPRPTVPTLTGCPLFSDRVQICAARRNDVECRKPTSSAAASQPENGTCRAPRGSGTKAAPVIVSGNSRYPQNFDESLVAPAHEIPDTAAGRLLGNAIDDQLLHLRREVRSPRSSI